MSFDLVISFPRISSTEICTYYLKRRGYEDRQRSNVCNSKDYKQPTRPKGFCFFKLWSSLTMSTLHLFEKTEEVLCELMWNHLQDLL